MLSLFDLLGNNARHLPDRTAITMGAEQVSYQELGQRAQAIAGGLIGRGLVPGDRVAVMSRHAVDYVSLYFACAGTGITLVPLSYWHRESELRDALQLAAPTLVVVEQEFTELLAGLALERAVALVQVENATDLDEAISPPWAALYGDPVLDLPIAAAAGHPHMMLFTSGTTGTPKGALISQDRTVEGAYGASLALRLGIDDVFVDCLRTFHSGSWDHLKQYLLVGARVVLVRDFDAATVTHKIERERVSVMVVGGTMLRLMMDAEPFATTDLGSLRLVCSGSYVDGGGLVAEFIGHVRRANPAVQFAATYGLTEFGPYVCVMPPQEVERNPGSAGRPIPGVRVELIDEDGVLVPRGTPGEVVAFGPAFDGYLDQPEASADSWHNGGLRTGDIAVEDGAGYLTLVDRKKDIVRSGAHNVFSAQVEACLISHGGLAEVAVVSVPDDLLGETVCAAVVLDPQQWAAETEPDLFVDSLQRHVRSKLAGYNVPKYVVALPELPRNSNGKILKRELRLGLQRIPETGRVDGTLPGSTWVSSGRPVEAPHG